MIVRGRVLSIQSHVVSGYVGNKAAVLPLQVFGFDVDVINSVQFSNHTGYRHGYRGDTLSGEQLISLVQGLLENNLLSCITHLLTGYVGSTSFLEKISDTIVKLKEHNPGLTYLCDPVLGDNGKLYVPETLIPVYREKVIVHASYLTPNSFELSVLSEMKVQSETDVFVASRKLHESAGVPCIIVTSSDFIESDTLVTMFVSNEYGRDCFCVEAPRLPGGFTGSGDLTAALLLAWLDKCKGNIRLACSKAMASVSMVLKNTVGAFTTTQGNQVERACPFPELALIASIPDLLKPSEEDVGVREYK